MITNRLKLMIGAVAIAATAVGTTAVAFSGEQLAPVGNVYAGSDVAYNCASVHFGMNDDTHMGDITSYGTSYGAGKTWDSIGLVSGITLTQFKVEGSNCQWLAEGGSYTHNKTKYTAATTNGFKMGKGASITFTFTETVIGCDVYAVGWNDSNISFTVNESEAQSVPKNTAAAGNFAPQSTTYTKYHFDFTDNQKVVITVAANTRMFIGDVALRVKNN